MSSLRTHSQMLYEADYLLAMDRNIKEALDDSPSLKSYLEIVFGQCYAQAVKQAKAETGLSMESFPVVCPYQLPEVTNDEFLPE
ncbi:DUF29 family protein [Nostoc sp.]